jgi:RHS repeat-associated protein
LGQRVFEVSESVAPSLDVEDVGLVKQAGTTLATYQHNAFGERVRKTANGSTRLFVYDEDGRLLGEYDGSGALIQETVWLEDTPVAMIQPRAGGGIDIRHVWADHLDTPRAITTNDAAATVLWTWDSDPFGTTAATGSIEYNLRFPGQYFDAETGTHYNYFRDYNPATGRYQQSDPIGLGGGPNTYSFVDSSPLIYIDATGESYKRPRGATTPGQRSQQRGLACSRCGATGKMFADHKTPLAVEFCFTGTIDTKKMRESKSVQPMCQKCSCSQGGKIRALMAKLRKCFPGL